MNSLDGYIHLITPKSNQHFAMIHENIEHVQGEYEAGIIRMFHEAVQP